MRLRARGDTFLSARIVAVVPARLGASRFPGKPIFEIAGRPMVRRVLDAEPEYRERVVSKIPIGRIAEPNEIVGSVIYLASAASSMVTGAVISVDGGYTAQ